MALTTFTNGSSSGNIIQASWFNQYHDLLTGVMTDQAVTITNALTATNLTASYTMSGANALVLKANATDAGEHDFGLIAETGAGLGIYDYSSSTWLVHFARGGVLTSPGAAFSNNTLTTWSRASGSVDASIYTDTSNNFNIHAADNNKVIITSKTGSAILTIDGGGSAVTLPNSYLLQLSATTGTNGSMYVNSSNDLYIHAANDNKIILADKTSAAMFTIDGTAGTITTNKSISGTSITTSGDITCGGNLNASLGVTLGLGALARISTFYGTGSGTFNHGLSVTPADVIAHGSSTTNAYISTYSYSTTQFSVVISSAVFWSGTAWVG